MDEKLPGVSVPPAMIAALERRATDAANVGVELVAPLIDADPQDRRASRGIHVMAMGHDEETRDLVTRAGLLPRPCLIGLTPDRAGRPRPASIGTYVRSRGPTYSTPAG